MNSRRVWIAAAFAAAIVAVPFRARAEEATPCAGVLSSSNIVSCALRASLSVRSGREEVAAAEGRRTAVSPFLPSNPVVTFSAGPALSSPVMGKPTWYVALGQELEIGGQRRARQEAADAELTAQRRRVVITERDTAARALDLYYGILAAEREVALTRRVETASKAAANASKVRAERGLLADVDADVAAAAAARVELERIETERRSRELSGELATLVGRDPSLAVVVEGDLLPLPAADRATIGSAERSSAQRPDILALGDESRAFQRRAEAFRRSRWPNPTVSLFAQNDAYDGRTVGIGISIPIPLPGVGRTYRGEIAEAEAQSRRAASERDRATRAVGLEVATAFTAYEARQAQVAAITPERVARSEKAIDELAAEIERGRLSVREAVVTQQSMLELLRADIAARRDLCLASVAVARATGVALEGGAR